MKKTINTNLNGIVFNFEEDAFTQLNNYLDALKQHFGDSEYGKEIIADIESRFAEQFSAGLKDRKSEVVSIEQVNEKIKAMGSVSDLTTSEKTASKESNTGMGRRRLYRNPDDAILSGVSSGIASYFNIDPLIPRILFVVSAFMGGYGILLYILLWMIVPKAETNSQKLEMKGATVNIANLEDSAKEHQKRSQNFSVARYFFRELFYLLARFLRVLGPIILSVIGILITAAAVVALFGGTLLTLLLLFDPNSPYIDPAITQVFNGSEYVLLVSSGFVTGLIPVLAILLCGISLIRHKNTFTKSIIIAMVVFMAIAGLTFGFMATSAAPQIDAAVKSIESRPESSKEFKIEEFTSISTHNDERIKISYGPQTKVVAYGREEEIEKLQLKVENNTLNFDYKDDFRICIFCINKPTTFQIITPNLNAINAANSSRVDITGFNNITDFKISAKNAARVNFSGKTDSMIVDMNNASKVNLSGNAKTINAKLTNASRLEADSFTTLNALIEATNSSDAEIRATQKLDATASGASHIRYSGNPKEESTSESDSARITKN